MRPIQQSNNRTPRPLNTLVPRASAVAAAATATGAAAWRFLILPNKEGFPFLCLPLEGGLQAIYFLWQRVQGQAWATWVEGNARKGETTLNSKFTKLKAHRNRGGAEFARKVSKEFVKVQRILHDTVFQILSNGVLVRSHRVS